MKKAIVLMSVMLMPALGLAAPKTCVEKQAAIEQDISYAKEHQQTERVSGLETALKNLKDHCSDAQLKKEYDKKVEKKQTKLEKATRELDAAVKAGKSDKKIQSRKDKVEKAKAELEKARAGE